MPFDGLNHTNAEMTTPYSTHPKAPHTAVAYQTALTNSLVCARYSARSVFQTTFPVNMQSIAGRPYELTPSTWARFGEGRKLWSNEMTHICAQVGFRLATNFATDATFRLVITDGVDTDTQSPASVRTITGAEIYSNAPWAVNVPRGWSSGPRAVVQFGAFNGIYVVNMELERGAVTEGAPFLAYVEGYGTPWNGTYPTFRPVYCSAWLECRG